MLRKPKKEIPLEPITQIFIYALVNTSDELKLAKDSIIKTAESQGYELQELKLEASFDVNSNGMVYFLKATGIK